MSSFFHDEIFSTLVLLLNIPLRSSLKNSSTKLSKVTSPMPAVISSTDFRLSSDVSSSLPLVVLDVSLVGEVFFAAAAAGAGAGAGDDEAAFLTSTFFGSSFFGSSLLADGSTYPAGTSHELSFVTLL